MSKHPTQAERKQLEKACAVAKDLGEWKLFQHLNGYLSTGRSETPKPPKKE